MPRLGSATALVLAVAVAGCTDTTLEQTATSPSESLRSVSSVSGTGSSTSPPGRQELDCSDPFGPAKGVAGLDAPLVSDGLDGWVLLLGGTPLSVDEPVKVIWKVGSGSEPGMVGVGPRGEEIEPMFLNEQGGSPWDRPGDLEWGTGWTFPQASCWELRVTRGDASAGVEVPVA